MDSRDKLIDINQQYTDNDEDIEEIVVNHNIDSPFKSKRVTGNWV